MKTRTTLPPIEILLEISHADKLFCLGSCFAETIGNRLSQSKIDTLVNPYGTMFNPLSILRCLALSQSNGAGRGERNLTKDNQHLSYDYHSDIRSDSPAGLTALIHEKHLATIARISEAQHIIITLGTSYYYELLEDQLPVANCHKKPNDFFQKKMMTSQQNLACIESIYRLINQQNSAAKIIWTVSPIRHLRDTLINNNRSKANLISAVHDFIDTHPSCHYFPAYELMMDDLRDYRYYADDMIHPSAKAISYIWEIFKITYMSADTRLLNQRITKINKSLAHMPFNPMSPSHKTFQEKLLEEMTLLMKQKNINFIKEIDTLKQAL